MSIIYLAGPIDYGTNDSVDRRKFIDSISEECIVYDATTTFRAPLVDDMSIWDMKQALKIHHAAVEACSIFVADMRQRSVGIPIEMWMAYERNKPIYVLYDEALPKSIYIEAAATEMVYSWADMLGALSIEMQFA